jgi:hypothetical protein
MNKMYVIQWKSNVNGRAGKGTKLFKREEAERLAEELNREYPQIQHELLEAAPQSEAAVKPAESEAAAPMELVEAS